jgi:hypothetical protein
MMAPLCLLANFAGFPPGNVTFCQRPLKKTRMSSRTHYGFACLSTILLQNLANRLIFINQVDRIQSEFKSEGKYPSANNALNPRTDTEIRGQAPA